MIDTTAFSVFSGIVFTLFLYSLYRTDFLREIKQIPLIDIVLTISCVFLAYFLFTGISTNTGTFTFIPLGILLIFGAFGFLFKTLLTFARLFKQESNTEEGNIKLDKGKI